MPVDSRSPISKFYRKVWRYFVDEETFEAAEQLAQYGFHRKSSIRELGAIGLVLGIVSLIIWIVVRELNLERVPWSQAFTAVLSLGIAVIAYRQWRGARHEISIDKYYDRLEVANKRLDAVETDRPSPEDMYVFAELDKLEYVIVKYEYGYISHLLALRALNNFKGICVDRKGFKDRASHWVNQASYRAVTRRVVMSVCEHC